MSRLGWVFIALICILLGIGWYFLLFDPTSEDIADTRAQTEQVELQAQQQRARAAELREVREQAPEAEARLAVGRSLIPEGSSIPSLFRQLQQAADDAGARLTTISPSQPSVVELEDQQLSVIGISMTLEASYFQVVDLARRIEDPQLTPRALRWTNVSLTPTDFPTLSVSLSGEVFSRGLTEIPPVEEEQAPAEPEDPDAPVDPDDPEGDVEGDEVIDGQEPDEQARSGTTLDEVDS